MADPSARVVALDRYLAGRGLRTPPRLADLYRSDLPDRLSDILCCPAADGDGMLTLARAEALIDSSDDWPLLPNLVPLLVVDEQSFACVVASALDSEPLPGEGRVVRWHRQVTRVEQQAALLDVDCLLYAESVADELDARDAGINRVVNEIGPAYDLQYLEAERRPRDFVFQPVRIACQNVVVALGSFAHDASVDGLAVAAWQTCEVPHVAANEANRALTALMLCDAFQSGGTMEIRFDRPTSLRADGVAPKSGSAVKVHADYRGHPEGRVPAALRRFGRTVGVTLGADPDNRARITPAEARRLFLAITPMPDDLAQRVDDAIDSGVATPERLCFTLLSQVWREIELDFMLAVSSRAGSLISGGADFTYRTVRQAESEVARAALMIGMYFRRLDTKDGAGAEGVAVRALEDNRVGIWWAVNSERGAVRLDGLRAESLPWQDADADARMEVAAGSSLTVLPRPRVTAEALATARELSPDGPVAIVIPRDGDGVAKTVHAAGALLVRCPDRVGELDQMIERKLLEARISRA